MEINGKKVRPLPIILGVVALIAAVFAFNKIRYMLTYEDTENSYLETDITSISAKVQGFIADVRVKENQHVRKGDTLFILDNRDYLLRVSQAEAALKNAEANVGAVAAGAGASGANVATSDANTQTAAASVETAQTTAQTAAANLEAAKSRAWQATQDYNRFKTLFDQRAATQQQYEQAKTARESADAALAAAQSQLETAQKQVEVARRQETAGKAQRNAVALQAGAANKNVTYAQTLVDQRRVDLETAKLNLSYTVVTAPADGVVAKKSAQVGQLVNPGTPLCSLVSDQSLWVTANFKETQVAHMHEGQSAIIKVDAYEGKSFNGKIESISPATGSKFSLLPPDNASGNFVKVVQRIPVRVALTDAPDPEHPLRAGMSVKVAVPVKE